MRNSVFPHLLLRFLLLGLSSCSSCNQTVHKSPLLGIAYDDLSLNEDSEEEITSKVSPQSRRPIPPPPGGEHIVPEEIRLDSGDENLSLSAFQKKKESKI